MSSASNDAAPADEPTYLTGLVTRSTGRWLDVNVGDRTIPSRIRGKFRLEEQDVTNPIAVGDRVTLRLSEDDTGLVTEIHERRNKLSRRAAGHRAEREHVIVANVDRAWGVQAVRLPRVNPGFVDRFLVMAEVYEIPAGLIFNKVDLMRPTDRDEIMALRDLYEGLGYPVFLTSATEGTGLGAFCEALADKVNVITGPSGVGKSTLLNAIEPGLDITTGSVSQKTNKGTHTTTHAALHSLSNGGYVVDTPGIREFGILDLAPDELAFFFVEFLPYLNECRFDDCTHDHEPGCAIKDAVAEGTVSERRYDSYLNILDSLRSGAEAAS
jgi:ribosome biogenesis GTPase